MNGSLMHRILDRGRPEDMSLALWTQIGLTQAFFRGHSPWVLAERLGELHQNTDAESR
jgi:hypothetical protein